MVTDLLCAALVRFRLDVPKQLQGACLRQLEAVREIILILRFGDHPQKVIGIAARADLVEVIFCQRCKGFDREGPELMQQPRYTR